MLFSTSANPTGFLLVIVFLLINQTVFGAENEIHQIDQARVLLYQNHVDKAEIILLKIDSTLLTKGELGMYQLTLGFLKHMKGDYTIASEQLRNAQMSLSQYGHKRELAELNLILGFMYEQAQLKADALKSFLDALVYFSNNRDSDYYLYALLGAARTSSDNEAFLKEAEAFIAKNGKNRNQVLYWNTKAVLETNRQIQVNMIRQALRYFDEYYDHPKHIAMLTGLALHYEALGKKDSATYFLSRSESLIAENGLPEGALLNHYIVRAYFEQIKGETEKAEATIDLILDNADGQFGVLAEAYLRKSSINRSNGNFKAALDYMQEYSNLIKKEFSRTTENQTILLSIRYQVQQKELQLARVKIQMLFTIIISAVIIIVLAFVFLWFRKISRRMKMALEQKLNITHKRFSEHLQNSFAQAETEHFPTAVQITREIRDKTEFESFFKIKHPLFLEKLRHHHPELSIADIKYCTCLLSGLSLYQTAQVLNVSISAVKKGRKKVREELGCSSLGKLTSCLEAIDERPLP